MDTYKIAISTWPLDHKIAHGSNEWRGFNASFENREIGLLDFANEVYTGHAFTTWHSNRWRHGSNYLLGQHLGVDFDRGDHSSSIDGLTSDKFVSRYASLVYSTPSSTPEAPKSRVVFLLDKPIQQAQNYALAAQAMLWIFGNADQQCKDPARFFYGSKDCDIWWEPDNILPLDVVIDLVKRYQVSGNSAKRRKSREGIVVDPTLLVQKVIVRASYGNRNNLGFWLACRLFEDGMSQTDVEDQMRAYQTAVQFLGGSPYSLEEAMGTVKSAMREMGVRA